jgi:vitamin B12 transporter
MFIRVAAALAACVSFLSITAVADQADSANDLDDVVVTASRVAQPISEVIGSVTVIDREEIERRQSQSLQDLLRGEAGIDIYNNGGLGKVSGIFMRGSNTAQTLILVDGQRLGSATDGTTAIQFIPVDQIDRIEIVRGPRSSLYGSDAIGGVIQIFTRKGNRLNAALGYGYHNTQTYSAGAGITKSGLRFSVHGNYMRSNGFDSCRGDGTLFVGCYTNEPDDDRYRNLSGSAHIGYNFGTVADIEFHDLYSNGYTEFDGYFNQGRFTEHAPGIKLSLTPNKSLTLTASGSITHDDQDNYHDAQFLSRYNTEKHNASLLADWKLNSLGNVMVGADYLRDHIDTVLDPTDPTVTYDATSRNSHGEFVQFIGKLVSHELSVSARSDQSNQYGTHNTGSLGWKWQSSKYLSFNAGWGLGFHAPTFNDLYFPYGSGNPDLKPEGSTNIELGASGNTQWINWSLQVYNNRIRDLIALDGSYRPVNTDAEVKGAEFMINGVWGKLTSTVNYTWLDPRNRQQGANYNKLLSRRARQSGRVELGYKFDHLLLTSLINVAGPRFDDLANQNRMGGYTTLDVGATWNVYGPFVMQFKLNNILDHRYETAQYYNQEGRSMYVTLRYQSK